MNIVGEIRGLARVRAGWHRYDGVRYRIDIWEVRGRRQILTGNLGADPDVVAAVQEFGEATIDLPGGLGSFAFVVTSAPRGEIKLTGPVTRFEEQKEWR